MLGALLANKTERQILPQLLIKTYLRWSTFLPFFQKNYRKYCLRDNFGRSNFLETYFRKQAIEIEINPRVCSVGYVQNHSRGIDPGITRTGTSVRSVPPPVLQ